MCSMNRLSLGVLMGLLLVGMLGGHVLAQTVGGEVRIAITQEPDTLDPQKTATAVTAQIMRYAADTLVTQDMDGEYVPALATSWDVSEDGLTWMFHLRRDVRFHNGTPLTAHSVKQSFERALAPETQSPIAGSLFGPIASMDVPDDYTFVITLSEPFSPFLDNLTDPRAGVVDTEAANSLGADFGRAPVLTGPWQIESWRSGDRITLVRNPAYVWGPEYTGGGPAHIQRLVFRVIPEAATQVAAFEAGEVDVLTGIPSTDVERLQAMNRFQIFNFLRKGVGLFMEFNVTKPPFDDILVRRAINHAINKDIVLQVALQNLGETAYGPLPPSIWGYWEQIKDYAPDYDPDQAVSLLEQAGWTRGSDGQWRKDGAVLSFTLSTQPTDSWNRSAQVVQAQLRQLGIQMEIENYEFGTLLERLSAGLHQANFMGYTYTSPDIFFLWFHSTHIGTGLAHSHFDDSRMDELIEASRRESNADDRAEIYRELQQYVVDNALWVPLWTNYQFTGVLPRVMDADIHPEGFLVLMNAYVED